MTRTGDFLAKIINTIRGCGFGIAIFSDATPPQTLANIFFEVGYCLALGKPTYLLLAGANAAPSDFVRTEWIEFRPNDEVRFRTSLGRAFEEMESYGEFCEQLALTAEDAEDINTEQAIERFKRAYLLSRNVAARDGVQRLQNRLKAAQDDAAIGRLMRSFRRQMIDDANAFLRMTA